MEEFVMAYCICGEIRVSAESYAEAVNEAGMEVLHTMGHLDVEELLIDGFDYWEWKDKDNV